MIRQEVIEGPLLNEPWRLVKLHTEWQEELGFLPSASGETLLISARKIIGCGKYI